MAKIIQIAGLYLTLVSLTKTFPYKNQPKNNNVDFLVVHDIKEYQEKNPSVKLQPLTPTKIEKIQGQARATQFSYVFSQGVRFESDRLLVRGYDSNEFPMTRTFKETMQYPDPSTDSSVGPIINYFEVTIYQSNNVGAAYVAQGGIGYRKIQIVVEFVDTLFYGINALIYGYNG